VIFGIQNPKEIQHNFFDAGHPAWKMLALYIGKCKSHESDKVASLKKLGAL